MRTLLAAGALTLATGPVFAACNPTPPPPVPDPGNVVTFQCDSDNQATDADDLKLFLDKATGVTDVDGSLNKNSSILGFQNIHITANSGASFNQEGNGFADLHSSLAGQPNNNLNAVTFTPIVPSTVDGLGGKPSIPFLGFDGFFGRGQVDPIGSAGWDGIVTLVVDLAGGGSFDIAFTGDTKNDDIGSIGFDESKEPGALVASVTMQLDSSGAWNEVKEFDFSVPGGETTIPEPSTWAMMLLGFAGLAYAGYSRGKKRRLAAG